MAPSSPVDELLRRWQDLCAQGPPPSAEELCRDRPELLDELRRRLVALETTTREFRDALSGLTPVPSTDADPAEPPALRPGDEPLPGFRLERELGRGGFGAVWRAT